MMKIITLQVNLLLALTLLPSADAVAGWKDVLNSVTHKAPASAPAEEKNLSNVGQLMQNGQQAVNAGAITPTGRLTDLLMKRTGVSQAQAEGGAGALFQLAKSRMQSEAFAKLEQSVPGMQGLLGAVPAVQQHSALGGLTALAGSAGGTVGNLVSLAAAFQQQGMSPQMIQQFIPVVVDYVKSSGGSMLANSLSSALTGL